MQGGEKTMAILNRKKRKEENISARCYPDIKEMLHFMERATALSESEVVAKSIREYYHRHFPQEDISKVEAQLFGKYSSGKRDLSSRRKKYLKEKLREKHKHN